MSYAEDQAAAAEDIREAGALATLEWDVAATVDVVTDAPTTPSTATGTVTLAAFPLRVADAGSDKWVRPTQVVSRARKILLGAANLPITPDVGMRIVGWEGATWTIDTLAPIAPDGSTVVVYQGTMSK